MRPQKAVLSVEREAAGGQLVPVRSCAESAQSDADSIRPTGLQLAAPRISSVDRRAVRIAVRLRRPSVCRGQVLSARH